MAIGETLALEFGDVDIAGCEFRLRRATVKGGIRLGLWPVPGTGVVDGRDRGLLPARGSHRHPPRLSGRHGEPNPNVDGDGLHDRRHSRLHAARPTPPASVALHGQGVPVKELAARAGHARASMTLDVYSHVMPLEEVSRRSLRGRPGDVPVRSAKRESAATPLVCSSVIIVAE